VVADDNSATIGRGNSMQQELVSVTTINQRRDDDKNKNNKELSPVRIYLRMVDY
jgi:hypothetical protein